MSMFTCLLLYRYRESVPGPYPVPVKKDSSGEEATWESRLLEHQIRGRIGASASGLQGKGLHKRSVFSQTPVPVSVKNTFILFV